MCVWPSGLGRARQTLALCGKVREEMMSRSVHVSKHTGHWGPRRKGAEQVVIPFASVVELVVTVSELENWIIY